MQLVGEKIVDLECNIIELVELAWNIEAHLYLDWNEDGVEGNDVDDQH